MPKTLNEAHRWGVILAGGDGTRLRPLTHAISDDDQPKQFCPLLGGRTLLAQTRFRIGGSIDPSRILFALTRKHERFYAAELGSMPSTQMIVQPVNRGTLPAILWSLLRILRLDPCASVAFFPSDHYYSNESKFMEGVEAALRCAEANANAVILLSTAATRPEIEYGWIEPDQYRINDSGIALPRIKRLWEKPSYSTAESLLEHGWRWNTFVMVGRATAFLRMIERAVPGMYRTFEAISQLRDPDLEAEVMQAAYNSMPVADFSKQVLSVSTEQLAVAALDVMGWSDLGDPRRLVTTLFQSGIENPWVTSGCCNHCGAALAAVS
jgi:mannose-1-phosphate guanylyltransferase